MDNDPPDPPRPRAEADRIEDEHLRRVGVALGVTVGLLIVFAIVTGLAGQTILLGPLALYVVYRIVYDRRDLGDRRSRWHRRREPPEG